MGGATSCGGYDGKLGNWFEVPKVLHRDNANFPAIAVLVVIGRPSAYMIDGVEILELSAWMLFMISQCFALDCLNLLSSKNLDSMFSCRNLVSLALTCLLRELNFCRFSGEFSLDRFLRAFLLSLIWSRSERGISMELCAGLVMVKVLVEALSALLKVEFRWRAALSSES